MLYQVQAAVSYKPGMDDWEVQGSQVQTFFVDAENAAGAKSSAEKILKSTNKSAEVYASVAPVEIEVFEQLMQ